VIAAEKVVDILLEAVPEEGQADSVDIDPADIVKSSGGFGLFMYPARNNGRDYYGWSRAWPYVGRATITLHEMIEPGFYIHLKWNSYGIAMSSDPNSHVYAIGVEAPKVSRTLKWLIAQLEEKLAQFEEMANSRTPPSFDYKNRARQAASTLFEKVKTSLENGGPSPADPPPSNVVVVPKGGRRA